MRVRVLAVVRGRQQARVGPEIEGPPTNVTIAVSYDETDLVSRAIAQNIVALAILPRGRQPAPAGARTRSAAADAGGDFAHPCSAAECRPVAQETRGSRPRGCCRQWMRAKTPRRFPCAP